MAERKRPFQRPSISAQIILGTLTAVVLVLGLFSYSLKCSLIRLFPQEGNSELQRAGDRLADRLNGLECDPDAKASKTSSAPHSPRKAALGRFVLEGTEHLFVQVLNPEGKPLLESEGFSRLLPQSPLPEHESVLWRYVEGPTGSPCITYTRRFNQGWVVTAWDIRHENRLLKKSQDLMWSAWGLATLVMGTCVVVIARHGLKPLKDLEAQAEAIRPGALGLNIDPSALPRDLGSLAQKLKDALGRLDEAFSRLTTLNADVAHELRTPIHGVRIRLEGMLKEGDCSPTQAETLEGVIDTLDHLSGTLDQMLFLARSEDPTMALQLEQVEIAALLNKAAAPFEQWAEDRHIRFEVRLAENLELKADEKLVRRALHNLLANAFSHAPDGSRVVLEGLSEAGALILRVRDEGEGIPEALLSKLGERFCRPDVSRNRHSGGTGLGLAIVKNILRLHGGTLVFESEPGRGTTANLRFPRL